MWVHTERSLSIRGKDCEVVIQLQPAHCKCGRFVAMLVTDPRTKLDLSINAQDGWPRYYFDLARAQLEVAAWLEARGQSIGDHFKLDSKSQRSAETQGSAGRRATASSATT